MLNVARAIGTPHVVVLGAEAVAGGEVMQSPIDGVRAIHNAFRADIAAIDDAATAAARGTPGLEATVERFRFFNEILSYHAHGEEAAVFPILDEVAPLVAEQYAMDHR